MQNLLRSLSIFFKLHCFLLDFNSCGAQILHQKVCFVGERFSIYLFYYVLAFLTVTDRADSQYSLLGIMILFSYKNFITKLNIIQIFLLPFSLDFIVSHFTYGFLICFEIIYLKSIIICVEWILLWFSILTDVSEVTSHFSSLLLRRGTFGLILNITIFINLKLFYCFLLLNQSLTQFIRDEFSFYHN